LFWFAFDWRVGIERAAQEFATFVNERVRRGSAVIIIAHSLGCLVARWSLCKGLIPEVRVHTVIAAGPPFQGSARAFKALIEMPEIDKTLDWYLNLARRRWPSIADQITATVTKSLMTVNSILEIMPPAKFPLFMTGPTQLYDAFEWKGWPPELQSALASAEHTQRAIAGLPWPQHIPRTLILSNNHPTEAGYFIDANDPFSISATLRTFPGDGTVLEDSARAFGADKEILVGNEHEFLLNDPDTLRYLGTIF